MTQEEKDLLLKDLCGRLPYKVKCDVYNRVGTLIEVNEYGFAVTYDGGLEETTCQINNIKPYLLPLSSITDEQKYELHFFGFYLLENDETNKLEIINYIDEYAMPYGDCNHQNCYKLIDWLNKHHIDYRGLIDKGLAINATDLNIY